MTGRVHYVHPFRVEVPAGIVWRDERRLALSRKAASVLAYLVSHAGHVITREELLQAVWQGTYVQPDTLKVYVRELREVLGDDARTPRYIETLPGRGYRFIGAVEDDEHRRIFIGRHTQMERLRRSFEAAGSGQPQVVLIAGRMGTGKRSLSDAFVAEVAAAGARVAHGQCLEASAAVEPYSPVLDALTALCRDDEEALLEMALTSPTWLAELPAFARRHVSPPARLQHRAQGRMVGEFQALLESLSARRPFVLLLEDLHWADAATTRLIEAFAQRPHVGLLMIVGTYRPDPTGFRSHTLDELEERFPGHVTTIPLGDFSRQEVDAFIAARLPGLPAAAALAPELHRLTGGHPLFLVTAVEGLVSAGLIRRARRRWLLMAPLGRIRRAIPATLQTAIGRQFEQLPLQTRTLLQAAAQVGTRFNARLVASAAGFRLNLTLSILERLEATRLIVTREGTEEWPDGTSVEIYRFRHLLDAEALRRNTLPAAAARIQRRIIAELQQLHADRQSEIATDLANRCGIARDWPGAIEYLRIAADTAVYRGEPRQAVRLIRRALALASKLPASERPKSTIPLLERLAAILSTFGERLPAASVFKTLAARAARTGVSDVEARALVGLLQQAVWFSHDRALAQADRTLRWTRSRPDTPERAQLEFHARVVRILFDGWSDAEASRCQALAEQCETLPDADRARIDVHLIFQQFIRSDYERALRTADHARPILVGHDDWVALEYLGYSRAVTLLHNGRLGELAGLLEASLASAQRHGNRESELMTSLLTAWLEVESQAYWPALERAERALQHPAVDSDSAIMVQMARVLAGTAALGLGLTDRAAEHLAYLHQQQRKQRMILDWFWRAPLHIALSELALRIGRLDDALAQAGEAVAAARGTPHRTWRARALAARAVVHLTKDRMPEARRDLADALREIRGLAAPMARWRVFDVLALVHERDGRARRAEAARQQRTRELDVLIGTLAPGHYLGDALRRTLDTARGEGALS